MPYITDYESEDDVLDREDLETEYQYSAAEVVALLDDDEADDYDTAEIAEAITIALETERVLVTA